MFPEVLDPSARYNVLVFGKTAAFRHSAIDEALTAIRLMGSQQNFTVDYTEDATRFNDAFLSRYDVVVWDSTTGDVLNDTQQAAFERFIKAGGGYVGIHSATDTEYGWAWYGQLTGAYFRNHPTGTPTATIVVEDAELARDVRTCRPAGRGLTSGTTSRRSINPVVNGGGTDVSPRGQTPIHVLLKMDESTYAENDGNGRRRRRPPDRLVQALRRRADVLHRARPHRGDVPRRQLPAAPQGRHGSGGGRRRRTRTAVCARRRCNASRAPGRQRRDRRSR